jgi:hypothetical protein
VKYGIYYNRQGGSGGSLDGATHLNLVDGIIASSFKFNDGGALRASIVAANPLIKIFGYKTLADMLPLTGGTDTTAHRRDVNAGVSTTEADAHDAANPTDLWTLKASGGSPLVGGTGYRQADLPRPLGCQCNRYDDGLRLSWFVHR